jgi:FeS assembly SUF system regulator
MLKLGKLTDYAVVVLAEMAGSNGALLSAATLAARTELPEPTVSKILKTLASAGLVASVRGANGGYLLERAAASIPVTDIIAAMEGPVALTACAEGSHDSCARKGSCTVEARWNGVNKALNSALAKVTLADMVQ